MSELANRVSKAPDREDKAIQFTGRIGRVSSDILFSAVTFGFLWINWKKLWDFESGHIDMALLDQLYI